MNYLSNTPSPHSVDGVGTCRVQYLLLEHMLIIVIDCTLKTFTIEAFRAAVS